MHALMTAILLRMAWLDSFDADTQPEPPDREFAQVEQGLGGSEGNTVIAADAGRQAALLKKPFKHGESEVFLGGTEGFTAEQKTTGVIGDRQRIAVWVTRPWRSSTAWMVLLAGILIPENLRMSRSRILRAPQLECSRFTLTMNFST